MPRVPLLSPATGARIPPHYIHTIGGNFVDSKGRTLLLRGVNLSGSSKAPLDRPSYKQEDFFDTAEAGGESFVGRPLRLEDGSADIHLARLRGWGFNMLRYVFTWEALEHEGPGKYDFEFMDYTVQVLRKCKEYGFKVLMDPHQDIWSRFSGGSGAPYWTLHACGMNPRNFTATQATFLHCEYPSAKNPEPAKFPAMIWSTDYQRLSAQTLFAFFFAGRDFAPKCIIDDMNIQDYLTKHFMDAVCHLVDRIRNAGDLLDECVVGWDSMNEPSEGFIGHEDLREIPKSQTLKKGSCPTPMQGLQLGMGEKVTVENWDFGPMGPKRNGSVTIDPKGRKAWLSPKAEPNGVSKWGWKRDPGWTLGTCPWALHDVWDPTTGLCLQPDYFSHPPSDHEQQVVFVRDYWLPHWQKYIVRIRQLHPEAIHFVQPPVFVPPPPLSEVELNGRACYSAHYYDGLTLMTRHWNWFNADALGLLRGKYSSVLQAVKIGETAIRKSLREQLAMLKQDTYKFMGPEYPTLIGEIGTPFDMDGKRSYGYTDNGKYRGDYSAQQKALDASLNAGDGTNLLNWTAWTYCADSTHEWGDGWNMEDLSLFSADDLEGQMGPSYRDRFYSASTPASNSELVLRARGDRALPTKQLSPTVSMSALSHSVAPPSPVDPRPAVDFSNGSLYKFLTNGARAYRAFSRPWPTAVVGVPTALEFDIARAEFKLTVAVGLDDVPPKAGDEGPDGLATEIYIPVIHYAASSLLPTSALDGDIGENEDPSRSRLSFAEPESPTMADTSQSTSTTDMSQTTLVSNILDIEVEMSEGRYEVEGQTLKWWYPIPREGKEKAEYTIKVRRRLGPIKMTAEEDTWWQWICGKCLPAGCTIT